MAISKEQRTKNTANKLVHTANEAYEHPVALRAATEGRKQGRAGQDVVRAARNLGMDEATGSYDYSGSKAEHEQHRRTLEHHGIGYKNIHDKLARKE